MSDKPDEGTYSGIIFDYKKIGALTPEEDKIIRQMERDFLERRKLVQDEFNRQLADMDKQYNQQLRAFIRNRNDTEET